MGARDLRLVHIPGDHWKKLNRQLDGSNIRYVLDESRFTKTWRVTLIVVDGAIQGVALVRRFGKPGTFQDGLEFKEFREFRGAPAWTGLVESIPELLRPYLQREDGEALPPATTAALEAALKQASPAYTNAISELRSRIAAVGITGAAATAVKEQRDAVALGLEIAGIESRGHLPKDEPDPTAPFLSSLARQATSEASMIRHDSSVFDGWLKAESENFDVARFVDPLDPARNVTVLYADKERLERLAGTDLIYYCEHTQGFILVQYKRMRRTGGPGSNATYYPDAQLERELERFEALPPSPMAAKSASEWRLCEDAFFVKLVDEAISKPAENRLVRGHYLPITLVRLLISDATGGDRPRGWSADNIKQYLSNDEFLMLAKQGFIGTRGAATDILKKIVTDALRGGRGVVVTIDHTDASKARRLRHG